MPYCPKCELEFLDGVTTCNDCGVTLVTEAPPAGDRADLVEFYRTTDRLESNLIRDYLTDRGVDCVVFDTAPYPFNVSDKYERRVFVTAATKAKAREALDEALEAGMLSKAGHFVVEPS
ncbi:MAG: DUF2007 domain-containing protein [Deltaproteobacteria bacterium]|nr:DUF2007 domain-containing protein [Deltaproteobacteria bacterium]